MKNSEQKDPPETGIELIGPIPTELADQVADIYQQAFGHKFSGALWNQSDQRKVILASLDLRCGIVAVQKVDPKESLDQPAKVLGVVGFQHNQTSLTGKLGFRSLLNEVGLIKGLWAAVVFSLFERKAEKGQLVLDGIAVTTAARGKGVGTKLLKKMIQFAKENDYQTIRLDVIGDNEGAMRLYQRIGFQIQKTESFAFLRPIIGFSSSSEMIYQVGKTGAIEGNEETVS